MGVLTLHDAAGITSVSGPLAETRSTFAPLTPHAAPDGCKERRIPAGTLVPERAEVIALHVARHDPGRVRPRTRSGQLFSRGLRTGR